MSRERRRFAKQIRPDLDTVDAVESLFVRSVLSFYPSVVPWCCDPDAVKRDSRLFRLALSAGAGLRTPVRFARRIFHAESSFGSVFVAA